MERATFVLSIVRAMVGEVSNNLVAVTQNVYSDRPVIGLFFDHDLDEGDRESVDVIVAQVSSDFPSDEIDVVVEVGIPPEPPGELVFLRKGIGA